jgi:hypothetical protein
VTQAHNTAQENAHMSKDFSKPAGRRLRIALAIYDKAKRQFRGVTQQSALVTVVSGKEQARLWAEIERAIAGGSWRDDRPSDPAPADDPLLGVEA